MFYNDTTVSKNTCTFDSVDTSMSAQNLLNLNLGKKGMHIGHINIQGLQNKLEQIVLMLNSEENDIDLLGLSETKLKSFHPNSAFTINNYQLFRKDRVLSKEHKKEGGGLLIYVKQGTDLSQLIMINGIKYGEIK